MELAYAVEVAQVAESFSGIANQTPHLVGMETATSTEPAVLELDLAAGAREMQLQEAPVIEFREAQLPEAPEPAAQVQPLLAKVSVAAGMLDLSPSKVYSLVDAGHLPSVRVSHGAKAGIRIPIAAIYEFVSKGGIDRGAGPSLAAQVAQSKARVGASSKAWRE